MNVNCSFSFTTAGLWICEAVGSLTSSFTGAFISFLLTNYSQTETINSPLITNKTCSDVAQARNKCEVSAVGKGN